MAQLDNLDLLNRTALRIFRVVKAHQVSNAGLALALIEVLSVIGKRLQPHNLVFTLFTVSKNLLHRGNAAIVISSYRTLTP